MFVKKITIIILFVLLISGYILPTVALEVKMLDVPKIIHESPPESFVGLALSDNAYLVMPQYYPGIDEEGMVFLYDISRGEISPVPMANSFSKAFVVNKTVFFRHTDGFYSYSPVSDALTKLNVPIQPILTGFVTDGRHFITMWGDYWPRNLTFMLHDLRTGEQKQMYPGGYPNPSNPMFLSGDYFVYSDSGMLVADPAKRYLHAYNISSGETITLPKEEGYSQYLCNIWGDTIVYDLFSLAENMYHDPPERRMLNLKTMETEPLILPDGSHPTLVYPPYALLSQWDETTGVTTVKLVEVDLPPIVQPTTIPPMTEEPLPPQITQAGTPFGMTVGLIAFVLACVLAVLWREK